jgi:dynamin GTPase
VDRIIQSQIRDSENRCKEYVKMMIGYELAYMNTNHPDFIGFAA